MEKVTLNSDDVVKISLIQGAINNLNTFNIPLVILTIIMAQTFFIISWFTKGAVSLAIAFFGIVWLGLGSYIVYSHLKSKKKVIKYFMEAKFKWD